MAIRRLLRGQLPEDDIEAVAREAAARQGSEFESVRELDSDNWLSIPCVVNEELFVKIITEQNAFVHALLTAGRNLGAFTSRSEGFFQRFETPINMAEHDLEATRQIRELGINAPEPIEVFSYGEYGVLVLEFLHSFNTVEGLEDEAIEVISPDIFASLSTMHDAGLAHGDLRGENVLVVDGELYFIDATKVKDGALEDARAYDIACALAALQPHIGARTAVQAASEFYPDEDLLEAEAYLDFVNLRPDHDFDTLQMKGEIEKEVS
ncbi:RIO1 family regulatory kinase/ATPase [Halovenus rubra]|uniref:non-specific serine/threonine protein kinase n=2 Tax=Halovenus rubra TaxID=869890 RepID=A0ABD5XAJ8_9EURY|nr:RIO1 family regulatory kinase/ATPase [Halovenus rubra]